MSSGKGSPEWRGRPDYAGARVLKSAAPVKGRQATTRIARRSAYSSKGQWFKLGLSPSWYRNGLARIHPTVRAARQAGTGRSSQIIHAAAASRHRSEACRYGDTMREQMIPTGTTRHDELRSLQAVASTR